MLEYGQPLHAFDASCVRDEKIIVRVAKEGEKVTTLDGKGRTLESNDLLITDPQNILGIAGVMGGKDSEVTDSTTTILLEAAIFDPILLRKTATRLGLTSEASKRFYHGLTKSKLFQALNAAIKMYQDLGGKLVGLTIIDNLQETAKKIKLTHEKVNSLVGVDIPAEQIEQYLNKLHFELIKIGGDIWEVTPPYWRLDIEIEEDLIEEVARMYGYEKIPAKPLEGKLPEKIDQSLFDLIYNLKKALVNLGLTEVQTYSYFSSAILNNFALDKNNLVKVANPISAETEYLREDLWPNLVEVIDKNLRQGYADIAIFEIGKVYSPQKTGIPKETYRLSLALMNNTDNPTQELYQIFQGLPSHISSGRLDQDNSRGEYEQKYFHPKRFAFLEKGGKSIGGIAEVHPKFLDKFGINKRVAMLELGLEFLIKV